MSVIRAKAVTTAASNNWSPASSGLSRWAAIPPPTTAIKRKAVPTPSATRRRRSEKPGASIGGKRRAMIRGLMV